MFLTNFWYKYPELAKKEIWILTLLKDMDGLLKWDYIIEEMYCTDPNCDCRKVSFFIIWPNKETYYLDYWFEKPDFYIKWWIWSNKLANEMSWLSVNTFNWDIEENKKIFENMKYILKDTKYIEMLKEHYKLMKEKVDLFEDINDKYKEYIEEDIDEDSTIILDNNSNYYNMNMAKKIDKKVLKERKNKKLAQKQRKINRKKKK